MGQKLSVRQGYLILDYILVCITSRHEDTKHDSISYVLLHYLQLTNVHTQSFPFNLVRLFSLDFMVHGSPHNCSMANTKKTEDKTTSGGDLRPVTRGYLCDLPGIAC